MVTMPNRPERTKPLQNTLPASGIPVCAISTAAAAAGQRLLQLYVIWDQKVLDRIAAGANGAKLDISGRRMRCGSASTPANGIRRPRIAATPLKPNHGADGRQHRALCPEQQQQADPLERGRGQELLAVVLGSKVVDADDRRWWCITPARMIYKVQDQPKVLSGSLTWRAIWDGRNGFETPFISKSIILDISGASSEYTTETWRAIFSGQRP